MPPETKTDELLGNYHKEVTKTARVVYLQAEALGRELNASIINVEEKQLILLNVIGILVNGLKK
jgi:hypothetical protein